MHTRLASIVIPCYNQARFVGQAIQSALAQTYASIEVVVVNDGSTDGSAEVIGSFGRRIISIEQENLGLSAARNRAIRAANGEYIVLLDADDMLLPNCVESRLLLVDGCKVNGRAESASINNQPSFDSPQREVGIVAGYYREIDAEGQVMARVPEVRRITKQDHFYQAVRRNWGPPVGWLISRRALDLCGLFDPFLTSCEDWDLLMRIATKFDIAYDPAVGANYRQIAGQMSRKHFTMYDAGAKALAKNSAYAPNKVAYWWWSQFGRFQHGRRILYNVLKERKPASLMRLCLLRPAMLWMAPLSGLTYLFGKRASSG